MAATVVVVILRLSRRLTSVPWAVALGGLLGGALGNLTDRALREPAPLRGHVIDFLELPNFPVFNLADTAIVGSAHSGGVAQPARRDLDGSPPGDRPDDGSVGGPERVDG